MQIVKPYQYTNGQLIDANQLDANLDALYTAINGNLDGTNLKAGLNVDLNGVVDVKSPAYNASGSALATTGGITSGSFILTLTAALDFVNGQGIAIVGAGVAGATLVTSIANGAGTTQLTLNTAASTTVTSVAVNHEDTVALQAAINQAITLGKKEIILPYGTYNYGVLTSTSGITFIGDSVTLIGTTALNLVSLAALSADVAQRGFNVKNYGAKGDGITDDTNAVKAAVAAAIALRQSDPFNSSLKTGMPTIYFPSGVYVISDRHVFNPSVSVLEGINIEGAGYHSTMINYTYVPVDADSYLMTIGGTASWSELGKISNIKIYGNGLNKFFAMYSQSGAPQVYIFENVFCHNLMEFVTIHTGTNANADRFRFYNCGSTNGPVGSTFFAIPDTGLSQSVDHEFYGLDTSNFSGTIFYLRSGGPISVFGGSIAVTEIGRIIDIQDSTGSNIGSSNGFYSFYGSKIEVRRPSGDVTPMVANAIFLISGASVRLMFRDMTFSQLTSNVEVINYGQIINDGKATFDNCRIPSVLLIKLTTSSTTSYASSQRSSVNFDNCVMTAEPYNLIVFDLTGASPNNYGSRGLVSARDCYLVRSASATTQIPIDVDINHMYGYSDRVVSPKTYKFTATPDFNFSIPVNPTSLGNNTKTLKLPIGSVLKRIRLYVYSSSVNKNFTFNISAGDAVVLQYTKTTVNSSSAGNGVCYESSVLNWSVSDSTKQLITIVATGDTSTDFYAGLGIPGFIELEYV